MEKQHLEFKESKTDSFINCITDGERSDLFITNGKCYDVNDEKWIVKQPGMQKTKAAGNNPAEKRVNMEYWK